MVPTLAGMPFVTTLLAPITVLSPMVTTRHHDYASTQPAVASNADGQIVLVCFLTQVSPKLA